MAKRTKVFISYAREDEAAARQLSVDLNNAGLAPWFDRDSLVGGVKWSDEIKAAIRDSDYFLALLSPRSLNKRGFVQAEIKHALDLLDEIPHSAVFLIPVRLENCAPSEPRLAALHWVDLYPIWSQGVDAIVRAIDQQVDESDPGTATLLAEALLGTAQVPEFIARGRSGLYDEISWSTALKVVNSSDQTAVVEGLHCEWHVPNGRLISDRPPALSANDDISELMDDRGELLFFPFLLPGNTEKIIRSTFWLKCFDENGRQVGFTDKAEGMSALPTIFGSKSNGRNIEDYQVSFVFHLREGRPQRLILNVPAMGFIGTMLDMRAARELIEHMKERDGLGQTTSNNVSAERRTSAGGVNRIISTFLRLWSRI